jgi:hypothetical protein
MHVVRIVVQQESEIGGGVFVMFKTEQLDPGR